MQYKLLLCGGNTELDNEHRLDTAVTTTTCILTAVF